MQNFYKFFPNPEPIPKRINYNKNENENNLYEENEENEENDNIYNEKNIFNDIKEDKNILYLLSNLNLENLYNVFMENCISFNDLFLLTKEDFNEMNIPIGPRNRILHFINEYKKFAQNFDFKELSNFLNYYKKSMNKPLINDINNNRIFISTNNINNVPFNCFNNPIINNFLNNQNNNDAICTKKENIEKINIFPNKIVNEENIFAHYKIEKSKNELKVNYNSLNDKNHNNDLTNLINSLKEKKYNNTTNKKLKKYNSINSSKKNMLTNSSLKKFGFSENNKNSNRIINSKNLNIKTKNNIKTFSSKNLKNNFMKDDRNKQLKSSYNINHKINYNKYGCNTNILLKNCNNSNYLLQKFQNIDKDISKFQKNYTKIQKNTRNISERLLHIFMSQKNAKINENLINYMYKDLEKEKIRNLNYEMNHNYRKNLW